MSNWMHSTALALTLGVTAMSAAQEPAVLWEEDLDAFLTVLYAEHDNPYFHTPKAELDAAIAAYRASLPELTRAESIAGLARIAALVGDGHTWMPMHGIPHDPPLGPGFRSLPVRFDVFEEGVFIVGATAEHADLVGAQVVAFGDMPAEAAHAAVMSVLPQDAVNFAAELAPEWLMQAELLEALDVIDNAASIPLTLLNGGMENRVTLEPMPAGHNYDWINGMASGPSGPDGALEWVRAASVTPLWREGFDGS